MPIVSHTKTENMQADGSTHVIVRLYDQDAREYMYSFFAPPGFNVDASITTRIAEMDEQLAQDEFEALVGAGYMATLFVASGGSNTSPY